MRQRMEGLLRIPAFRPETMAELGVSSKLNAGWDFLRQLRPGANAGQSVAAGEFRRHRQPLDIDIPRSAFL